MNKKFIIEDESHAEWQCKYDSFEDAVKDLEKRRDIPWNKKPNVCPCISWKTCGRRYAIIEFNTDTHPWKEINRQLVLEISSKESKWFLK